MVRYASQQRSFRVVTLLREALDNFSGLYPIGCLVPVDLVGIDWLGYIDSCHRDLDAWYDERPPRRRLNHTQDNACVPWTTKTLIIQNLVEGLTQHDAH